MMQKNGLMIDPWSKECYFYLLTFIKSICQRQPTNILGISINWRFIIKGMTNTLITWQNTRQEQKDVSYSHYS